MQRFWIQIAACNESIKEPWTFDEICRVVTNGAEMRPALKRSLRRALQGLVETKHILCLGTGKNAFGKIGYRPARYILNPTVLEPDDPRVPIIEAHLRRCMSGGPFTALINNLLDKCSLGSQELRSE